MTKAWLRTKKEPSNQQSEKLPHGHGLGEVLDALEGHPEVPGEVEASLVGHGRIFGGKERTAT